MTDEDEIPNPYESNNLSGSEKSEPRPHQKGDKLVVLATFDNSVDAHFLRNQLMEAGIRAEVANETTASMFSATLAGPSSAFWIEVLVLHTDTEKALIIKENFQSDQKSQTTVIPEWKCECGETVDEGFAVCWNCDSDYTQPN